MAVSIRLLSRTIDQNGRINLTFNDNSSYVFMDQSEYDNFVDINKLDAAMSIVAKQVLAAWSFKNKDALGDECYFDAMSTNRIVMRIRQ